LGDRNLSTFTLAIAIIDLVRYRSEGELPYRPYSDALQQHENRYMATWIEIFSTESICLLIPNAAASEIADAGSGLQPQLAGAIALADGLFDRAACLGQMPQILEE